LDCTIWKNEEAMRAFNISGAHRNIMRSFCNYVNEAATKHMEFNEVDLPAWKFIHVKLISIGTFSLALKEPSKNHLDRKIAMPKVTILTSLILPH
jgi:hypothetical protein